jgi:hypothetical protein
MATNDDSKIHLELPRSEAAAFSQFGSRASRPSAISVPEATARSGPEHGNAVRFGEKRKAQLGIWPKAAVISIRPGRQLSGDKLQCAGMRYLRPGSMRSGKAETRPAFTARHNGGGAPSRSRERLQCRRRPALSCIDPMRTGMVPE